MGDEHMAQSPSCKLGSMGDEHMDYLDDGKTGCPRSRVQNLVTTGSELMKIPTAPKQELKWQWLQMMDPHEPVLLFTKPLDRERLAAAGVMLPSDRSVKTCSVTLPYQFRGRMGRGGRIIFDRWKNPQHVTD
ncbi:hypothetical protein Taro_005588 [Colocasia esculenta]|uniref:Uncharacterized protein n=1 Tax=Colocasia esculenta TaxID=4460 RepID=A0A843TST6_COLES|nr:hypothetical protein [Colocasia esculenta]